MRCVKPLLLALSTLLAVTACGQSPAMPELPLVPRFGLALDGRPIAPDRLAALARQYGHRPGLIAVFEQWPENTKQPELAKLAESLRNIAATGATPVITWEPMFYRADGTEIIIDAARVTGGSYDNYIAAFAQTLNAHTGPVIIRLMHEPNLFRYHWGVTRETYDARAPKIYQDMWRHIVTRLRAALRDPAKVQLAFCVNAESVPGPATTGTDAWNTIAAYYPGDAWVDLLGVDGYNWGNTQTPEKNGWQSHWRSFADILGPAVTELRALANKPLYVFETASALSGGSKTLWLQAAAQQSREWQIAGLCWFEADKEVDWRLGSAIAPEAAQAFAGDL